MNLPYPVVIESAANGSIIRVGCQNFVFDNLDNLLSELRDYLSNPHDTIQRYQEKFPFMTVAGAPVPDNIPYDGPERAGYLNRR